MMHMGVTPKWRVKRTLPEREERVLYLGDKLGLPQI